ncbi:TIGR03364 family FAD-dependent oxidoreductase [Parafilimonas sp.]|uniref:TIGR03364 family FAD-dependent oxidoreductase n=1 Tax=Parafilimonas sp. TaxID=1969739 RepID=UPI0039E510D1
MPRKNAIVIGAGILGLATARSLAVRGYKVTIFERNEKAVGASVRNFGMVWPVGQPNGPLYERALRTRSIWKEVCTGAGLWFDEAGSLHLAYNKPEADVLEEFATVNQRIRPVSILNKEQIMQKTGAANPHNLLCALYCEDDMIVEARVAIEKIPAYLTEKYGVEFKFSTAINFIDHPHVRSGEQSWQADEIYVCSGADFETLYPEVFAANNFTKCKLQMMRLAAQDNNFRIGPALCGGLSLTHYKSFEVAASLPALKKQFAQTHAEYLKWGIHVMVSQNETGELTIGDSHEYGSVFDPFDRQCINQLITDYLKQFAVFKTWQMIQSWHGIYPKMTNAATEFIHQPQQGVTIINGIGGAGMTLSFGLAEEVTTNN